MQGNLVQPEKLYIGMQTYRIGKGDAICTREKRCTSLIPMCKKLIDNYEGFVHCQQIPQISRQSIDCVAVNKGQPCDTILLSHCLLTCLFAY